MLQLLLAIIYLAFVSLGLPDGLLGSAWPTIYPEFGVPVSYMGAISMIIALGTVVSSLQSDRMTSKFGAGLVTAVSVLLTAVALFGFSLSHSYWMLLLWAVPYGLGAGAVDAALNNFVALHYPSRHMSWLHCMWGIGATAGPYIMGYAISAGHSWNLGYRYVSLIQIVLTAILFASLPLWRKQQRRDHLAAESESETKEGAAEPKKNTHKVLTLKQIFHIPGAKPIMTTFFTYCAIESTIGLWAATYMVLRWNVSSVQAASYASLFYFGIMAGRAADGFITLKLNDIQMVRMGQMMVLCGVLLMLLPISRRTALAGIVITGLGCAPIYPSLIHATPDNFGADKSQALVGVQMASAYVGTSLMPPVFGLIAEHISASLFPYFVLFFQLLQIFMHEKVVRRRKEREKA